MSLSATPMFEPKFFTTRLVVRRPCCGVGLFKRTARCWPIVVVPKAPCQQACRYRYRRSPGRPRGRVFLPPDQPAQRSGCGKGTNLLPPFNCDQKSPSSATKSSRRRHRCGPQNPLAASGGRPCWAGVARGRRRTRNQHASFGWRRYATKAPSQCGALLCSPICCCCWCCFIIIFLLVSPPSSTKSISKPS